MTDRISRFNPAGLHAASDHQHITVVNAGRIAYVSGRCPADVSLRDVRPLNDQVDALIDHFVRALHELGAGPEHVVRSVIYVPTERAVTLARVRDRLRASALGPAFATASVLVGVTTLAYEGHSVDIELTVAPPD